MTRRTVLVTGGAGVVGARLLRELADRDWRTRCLVHRRRPIGGDELVSGDVTDVAGLREAVAGVQAIVHAAAVTHARTAHDYQLVNVDGTNNVVVAAEEAGVPRLLFVSTRAITPEGGAYSASKHAGEAIVKASKLKWTIVRLPEVYGGGSREGVDRIISAAQSGRWVPVVGRGDDIICPAHVDDVTRALAVALDEERAVRRTYTLAGPCLTIRELAELVARGANRRSRVVGVPTAAVTGLSLLARVLPVPLYPDQLARLRSPKPPPSGEAEAELGFAPEHPSAAFGLGGGRQ